MSLTHLQGIVRVFCWNWIEGLPIRAVITLWALHVNNCLRIVNYTTGLAHL